MSTELHDIPEAIIAHLKDVSSTFGLPNDEETLEKLTESWLEKKEAFEDKMVEMGMDEVGEFDHDDDRAALLLTFSGSLISLGPVQDGYRNVEYTSIGLRNDVPDSLNIEKTNLSKDVQISKGVEFESGPLKNTSPIFKIVVCPESLSAGEQQEMVKEAATVIVDTFVDMNKDLFSDYDE
ncbi:MAG: hypothetical protein JW874_06960 [Spirochaetales bacterium]|nr:hypothetical protein [Spirochaetales bacterium]